MLAEQPDAQVLCALLSTVLSNYKGIRRKESAGQYEERHPARGVLTARDPRPQGYCHAQLTSVHMPPNTGVLRQHCNDARNRGHP